MKNNQTTFARQRTAVRKQKAKKVSVSHAEKQLTMSNSLKLNNSQPILSSMERKILNVFRDYKMTPGKMLCFTGPDLEKFGVKLNQLTSMGLLMAEKRKGSYSLTESGFDVMKMEHEE